MGSTLTAKGENINRSNKELQPKSPDPRVGGSDPALCRIICLYEQRQSPADRPQVIRGKATGAWGPCPGEAHCPVGELMHTCMKDSKATYVRNSTDLLRSSKVRNIQLWD